MQARNTYLQFKWPHWQEILDKSDVSHMLVVLVCEDYWDRDQSIGVLPRWVTATYLTIVTQSCRPVATISRYRHLQFSHRYTVSYTVFRKGTYQHLLLVESTLHCPFTLSEYMKTFRPNCSPYNIASWIFADKQSNFKTTCLAASINV